MITIMQVVGGRWHMITIMLKERCQRAAGGAAAAGPSAANEAGERAPGASRLCGRWRDAQERRLVQRATPETTFASDLTSCCLEKLVTMRPLYVR